MISWLKVRTEMIVDVKVILNWLDDVKIRTEMISWCEGKNWNVWR